MIRKACYIPSSFTKANNTKTVEKQVTYAKETDVKIPINTNENYSTSAKTDEKKPILSAEKKPMEKIPQTDFNISAACAIILSAMLKNKNIGL